MSLDKNNLSFGKKTLSYEKKEGRTAQVKPSVHESPQQRGCPEPLRRAGAPGARVDTGFARHTYPVVAARKTPQHADSTDVAPSPAGVAAINPVVVTESQHGPTGGCIVSEPDEQKRTGLGGGTPFQRRADWGITAGPGTACHRPHWKHGLHLQIRQKLAAHLTSRRHIFLDVRHCNVGAVGARCETSVCARKFQH